MALALRLDRSKYHSTVHGEFPDEVRYWQDGLPFDAHGELVESQLSDEQKKELKSRKKPAVQSAAAPAADLDTQFIGKRPEAEDGGQTTEDRLDPSSKPAPAEAGVRPPSSEGEVNLELWIKGEEKHLPRDVYAAAKARYNKSFTNFADLVEFLVGEARLVAPEEVAPRLRPKDDAA